MENAQKILLKDVMVKDPCAIDIDESFSKVWDLFKQYDIRHLPVIDSSGKLKGIVTQRDLYRIATPRKTMEGDLVYDKADLDKHILKYVMTKEVYTLSPEDTLGSAVRAMLLNKYGCIPIVDDKKCLVGIITQIDVFKAVLEYFV
jgi:acetoin utilization protein AcuB